MKSVKKEKLWQIACNNFLLYSEGEKQHTVVRDIWDGVLNRIADMNEMRGDFEKALEALKKSAHFSENYDIQMVKFWTDQFFFEVGSDAVRSCKKKMVLDIHMYKLEHRNPLTTASGEIRPRNIEINRKIYVR